jgi:hypothetical protein
MITLSVPIRNSRLAVFSTALDSALAGGLLRIYAGVRPAIGELLGGQILLVEIRLPKPATWRLDDGKLQFAPIGQALCRRSGTAAWARLLDGDERWIADLDVGLPGSGAEVELSRLALFAGGALVVQLAEICE